MTFALGKPAEFADFIVTRRLAIVRRWNGFLRPEVKVVDFGCGNGASMLELAGEVASVEGIDISEEHRRSFESEKDRRKVSNCRFILKDLLEIEDKEAYDRAVSFEVLEHVGDDVEGARKIFQLLKPGGEAAVSVPNKWWVFETHGADLPLLPWNRVPFFSWLPRPIHERFARARIYTKGRAMKMMREAGLEVMDSVYVTAPMDMVKSAALKRFLRGTIFKSDTTRIPFLATAILMHVRKPGGGR